MLPCSRVSHAKRQLQEDFKIRLSLWETKPGGGKHFMPRGKGQAPLLASRTNESHRGGLWPQRWRLPASCCHTACLQYHQKGRGHPHGPFCHCGLDPSHLSGPTPWAAAIFVPQSRAGPSGCRPHVTNVVAVRRGAWLVGTQVPSQRCCLSPANWHHEATSC